ncbi:MAG: starch-binding protein [Lachnospiraceae bacterium]|nr:starch-binding protein [Lachnospiraceae bacterium]
MKAKWKKVTSLVLATVLGISGMFAGVPQEAFAAQKSVTAEKVNSQAETLKIHFKSPWGGANIFYWNVDGKYNNPVKWPGEPMEAEEDGWYSYTITTDDSADFMFNYEGKMTSDFVKESGEWWYADGQCYAKDPSEGDVTPLPTATSTPKPTATPQPTATAKPTATSKPEATPLPYTEGIKVHIKATGEKVQLTYWNVKGGDYSSSEKVTVDMTESAEGWFSYTLVGAESAKLLFTIDGQKTEETFMVTGQWWNAEGEWSDYGPNLDGTVVPTSEPTKAPGEDVTATPTITPEGEVTAAPTVNPTAGPGGNVPTVVATPEPTATQGPTSTPGPTPTPRPPVKGKIVVHVSGKKTIYQWDVVDGETIVRTEAWPGTAMTDEGNGWYTYTIEDTISTNIIFSNNGSGQTANLVAEEGEWWFKGGKWYDYDLSLITPTPKPTRKPTVTPGPTATPVPYDRTDFRDDTIYFVMTTRFYDGDPTNNVHCWDDEQAGNPDDDPAWRGDFKGLIEQLDYIKALGFTAIWITPVVENTSGYDYHGYHASDFSKVDSRYESEDCTYQDLINACHEKGMKIIQDVVLNHTGNFGEANLVPMFTKEGDQSTAECLVVREDSDLPENYNELNPDLQYAARLALMKNTDGENHDTQNLYHHYANFGWDEFNSQLAQIAGDCVDLNTENPIVYNYLIDCYTRYINMGVDAFRVDTTKHISRLTFNETFNEAFKEAGGENFFMFGEVCARAREVWYRNTPALSTPFYTWKETKDYGWSDDPADIGETTGDGGKEENLVGNVLLTQQHYNDNGKGTESLQPTSDNAFLNGNEYHTPDYSQKSGLDVIDFPMHWNFKQASDAFNVAVGGDQYYNDATWNVTYVDSHDYAPDGAPESERFNQSEDTWAENLNLMFTFRGIPCIYYGSEIQFQKGKIIDKGPWIPLSETGRAYYGDNLAGTVTATDFGEYTAEGTVAETLSHPLAQHIRRLNQIRAAVPALRKGQYSTEGVRGGMAFKRRYTNAAEGIDSFVCVAITEGATFTGIPNGTYIDAVTGDSQKVTNGILTIEDTGKGNMRVYVLNDLTTKAPGKVGDDGTYLK